MRVTLGVGLMLVVACGGAGKPPPMPPVIEGACTDPAPAIVFPIGVEQREVDVPVLLDRCYEPGARPDLQMAIDVFGPDDQPVPFTLLDAGWTEQKRPLAVFRFTPQVPRAHRVVAKFNPGLGEVQRQLQVAEDHSAPAPVVLLPFPLETSPCQRVYRLDSGTVLCQRMVGGEGAKLFAFHAGGAGTTIPNDLSTASADEVWRVRTNDIERLVERPGQPGQFDLAGHHDGTTGLSTVLPAGPGAVLVNRFDRSHVLRFLEDGGSSETLVPALKTGIFGAAAVVGDELVVSQNGSLCRMPLRADVTLCLQGVFGLVAMDGTASWIVGNTQFSGLVHAPTTDGGFRDPVGFPMPTGFTATLQPRIALAPAGQGTPILRPFFEASKGRSFVPRAEADRLALEWHGGDVVNASERHVMLVVDGGFVVRAR